MLFWKEREISIVHAAFQILYEGLSCIYPEIMIIFSGIKNNKCNMAWTHGLMACKHHCMDFRGRWMDTFLDTVKLKCLCSPQQSKVFLNRWKHFKRDNDGVVMTGVAKDKEETDLVWREVENNRQDNVKMFPYKGSGSVSLRAVYSLVCVKPHLPLSFSPPLTSSFSLWPRNPRQRLIAECKKLWFG